MFYFSVISLALSKSSFHGFSCSSHTEGLSCAWCSRTGNLSLDALLLFPNSPLSAVGAEIITPCFSCESRNIICSLYICLLCICICIFVICMIFIFVYSFAVTCRELLGQLFESQDQHTGQTVEGMKLPNSLLSLGCCVVTKIYNFLAPKNGQAWSGQSEIPAAHYSESYSATVTQIFNFFANTHAESQQQWIEVVPH